MPTATSANGVGFFNQYDFYRELEPTAFVIGVYVGTVWSWLNAFTIACRWWWSAAVVVVCRGWLWLNEWWPRELLKKIREDE